MIDPQEIGFCVVYPLPIIKANANRIDLVSTINRLVPTKREIDPGAFVLAMILDAVSARHRLYRIDNFHKNKDIELLLAQFLHENRLTTGIHLHTLANAEKAAIEVVDRAINFRRSLHTGAA